MSEIDELRNTHIPTRRVVSPGLEDILYLPIPVLDHGFIRVIDYMGDDSSVVQAARVSYGKGTKRLTEDKGLINYLMRHHHTTPFEMCELKIHVKLPIFVARQWIRHRTANVNEYSARYSILDREFYIPSPEHLAAQSSNNRQGREATLSAEQAKEVMSLLTKESQEAYDTYTHLLNEDENGNAIDPSRDGLARELARMNLSLNFYTQWYWKTDLHNLLNFLRLRADSHAQYEIRVYADALLDVVKRWVPHTFEAFEKHQLQAVRFSRPAFEAAKRLIRGEPVTQEDSGLSMREWTELLATLDLSSQ